MNDMCDAAVVGAGFAGAAVAAVLADAGLHVVVIERQSEHRDLVRGEWLSPWGVVESRRIGLDGALADAGAWTIRRWVQWDETTDPADAPVWDLSSFTPGVEGPQSFRHHVACERFCGVAAAAGATFRWGARDVRVEDTAAGPVVTFSDDGGTHRIRSRVVIGAGGRACPVGKQVGITLERYVHHWGTGLAVRGIDGWPEDTQAMGTEGDAMFFVFPQGGGRARLYLNYATDQKRRFSGPKGVAAFLDAFHLRSVPGSERIAAAVPDGPIASYPSISSWTDRPCRGGVVLIGDEAGANDPVLGTGLSNSLRDARLVAEAVLDAGGRPLGEGDFDAYVRERTERTRRLRFAADLIGVMMAEFGPAAAGRRGRAWERARENPNLAAPLLANVVAPDLLPEFAFHPLLLERLLGDDHVALVGAAPHP